MIFSAFFSFLSAPSAFAACVIFIVFCCSITTGRGALWIDSCSSFFLYPLSFVVVVGMSRDWEFVGGGVNEWWDRYCVLWRMTNTFTSLDVQMLLRLIVVIALRAVHSSLVVNACTCVHLESSNSM